MEVLKSFDPDCEERKEKKASKIIEFKPKADLIPGSRCPTCQQTIERHSSHEELRRVVIGFKLLQGYAKDDKAWDRAFFARFSRPAKELLAFLGNWKDAVDCMQDVYEKLTGAGMTVTLETVIKHSAEWKKDKLEREGKRGIPTDESLGVSETW